ncbi:uncharacterized protein V6R79_020753 [Siganus canaliculatus]
MSPSVQYPPPPPPPLGGGKELQSLFVAIELSREEEAPVSSWRRCSSRRVSVVVAPRS